jgi:hypothetical protein
MCSSDFFFRPRSTSQFGLLFQDYTIGRRLLLLFVGMMEKVGALIKKSFILFNLPSHSTTTTCTDVH